MTARRNRSAAAAGAATTASGPASTAVTADQRRRRRPVELTLLRPIPGATPMHRLWAGTKLVALATLALVLGLKPTWPVIAAGAGLVTRRLDRRPHTPRLPSPVPPLVLGRDRDRRLPKPSFVG